MKFKSLLWVMLAGALLLAGFWYGYDIWRAQPLPPLRHPALAVRPAAPKSPAPAPTKIPAQARAPGFHVANWNVENLFDTVDDPRNRGDNEFLPDNPEMRWTKERFETKLENLAQVIAGMNDGEGPDILGLEEVENEEVIGRLIRKIEGKDYHIVHVSSPDPRGIDTALIFNSALFSLEEFNTYEVALKWRTTRDILHGVFKDAWGKRLHVLVNHWPSRGLGVAETDLDRYAAAKVLSRAIKGIFQEEPGALVIALGDFNDEPSSRSIRVVLDVAPYPSSEGYTPSRLYNLTSQKAAQGQGTFFHSYGGKQAWRMYDQIIVSGSVLESTHIEYDADSLWIIQPDYMLREGGRSKGSPIPTYEGRDHYRGGYSDHLPIGVRLTYR